ncbi:hypothetical protein [Spirosoma validum]|uniref:Uncharacterized protein n=1 Tax=Spirosoma validum TaxID=2771355 RepID=A0A927AZC8_9BACT|nr:hypothetical protein [Spirosoma validum]MBD2752523.1 hypothetical protein [Spirosoma validum]
MKLTITRRKSGIDYTDQDWIRALCHGLGEDNNQSSSCLRTGPVSRPAPTLHRRLTRAIGHKPSQPT